MQRLEKVTIGADPELFIINTKTGEVVSSIGLIPGFKGDPWTGGGLTEGFGLEIDNILAEFNIPPVTTEHDFVHNIEFMKNFIDAFVKEKDPDLVILCKASMHVGWDQLQSPEAREFGCSPDYNAYSLEENEKPQGEITNLRSSGFHIHLGYNNPDIATGVKIIKYSDMYLGIPSVIIDPDIERRSLYGKAGAFRFTDYGCEYRVLSSAMMANESTLRFIWKQLQKIINAVNNNETLIDENIVQECINNSDINLAERLINDFKLM